MVMVGVVGNNSLQADSHPKSVGLVWGLAAAWYSVRHLLYELDDLLQWWHG